MISLYNNSYSYFSRLLYNNNISNLENCWYGLVNHYPISISKKGALSVVVMLVPLFLVVKVMMLIS